MPSFFISHSSQDRAAALRVRQWLSAQGHQDLFLSTEPGRTITASTDWEQELWLQIRAKRAVVFLSSKASIRSRYCFAELALARAVGRPVFPLDIGGGPHPLLRAVQSIHVGDNWDGAFRALAADLHRLGLGPADELEWDPSREPYPGLRSFAEEDAGVFFGRSPELELLRAELERQHLRTRPPFVVVVGSSGVGKSSLVLAGLVPRLRRSPEWLLTSPVTPGATPTRRLAASLVAAGIPGTVAEVRGRLGSAPAALLDDVAGLLAATNRPLDRGRLLVVVDQFEQAFTLADGEQRAEFLSALVGLTEQPDSPVAVCATLRSDFLRRALDEPSLTPVLRSTFPVRPIDANRLRDVVMRPAERAAIVLEPELVDRILADTSGPEALPLLSYTLQQLTTSAGRDRRLTDAAYDALGGVEGTLRSQADAALADLASRGIDRPEVLSVLLRLLIVEPGADAVGCPLSLDALAGRDRAVVDRFVEARLLVIDDQSVRLAHEALVRAWPPLSEAVAANRADLEALADLRRAATEWNRAGRTEGYLLTAERLEAGRRWRRAVAAGGAPADPLVEALVTASEDRVIRDLMWRADQLGRRVLVELAEDPERAMLLALAAVDEYSATDIATRALHEAERAWRGLVTLVEPDNQWFRAAWFLPGGTIITVTSYGGAVREWDGATGRLLRTIRHPDTTWTFTNDVALSRDGSTLAIVPASPDTSQVEIWDVAAGAAAMTLQLDYPVRAVGLSSDGRYVAFGGYERLVLHDRHSARDVEYPVTSVEAVAVTRDGRRIVAGSYNSLVSVLDGVVTVIEQLGEHVTDIEFSHDDAAFVRAALDGTVVRYGDEEVPKELASGLGWVFTATFSADDSALLVLGDAGALTILRDDLRAEVVLRRRDLGRAGGFDATGVRVVTAGSGPTAATWDVRPDRAALVEFTAWEDDPMWDGGFCGERIVIVRGGQLRLVGGNGSPLWSTPLDVLAGWCVDPVGRFLAVTRARGVDLLDAENGHLLQTFDVGGQEWRHVGFSANGTQLWALTSDGSFARWAVSDGTLLNSRAAGVEDFVFTAAVSQELLVLTARGLHAFDLEAGVRRWTVHPEGSSHRPVFSPDGSRILVASQTSRVSILDAVTGMVVGAIEHDERLNQRSGYAPSYGWARWSPDGQRIALAGADGAASVWNAQTAGLLQVFVTTKDPLEAIDWSTDGERLLAVGRERAAVWDAPSPGRLVQRARARCWRSLGDEERFRYGLPVGTRGAVGPGRSTAAPGDTE